MSKVYPVDMATATQFQSELGNIVGYNHEGPLLDLKIKEHKSEYAAKGYSRRELNALVRDSLKELAAVNEN